MGSRPKSAQRDSRGKRPPQPVLSAGDARERIGLVVRERRRALRKTLQEVADAVGCAKSYLWLIEQERRANPASDELLAKLEGVLGLETGRLIRAARWQSTPAAVRAEVESREAVTRRLVEILAAPGGAKASGRGGSLDGAYKSGELKRLVERLGGGGRTLREGRSGRGGAEEAVGEGALTGFAPAARGSATSPAPPGGGWREVPLINKVAAGYPHEFTDLGYPVKSADEYVRCPDLTDPDAFAARVVGDSMLPDYREGDIVVFSPARPVSSGMDCFARIEPDHESTFKRAYFESGAEGEQLIRLQPLNPAYAPRVLPREQVAGLFAAVSVTRKV